MGEPKGPGESSPLPEVSLTLQLEAAEERLRVVRVGDLTMFARGEDPDSREGLADVRRALETSLNMAMPQLRHRARVVKHLGSCPR